MVSNTGFNRIWIGGQHMGAELKTGWKWVTGETWAFTNWQTSQPDNDFGAEHYLELLSDARWNDALSNSSTIQGFIVEFD